MNRTEILYGVQNRLIGDLRGVIKSVETEFGPQLKNKWVFNHVDDLFERMKPQEVSDISFDRNQFQATLQNKAYARINTVQSHVPEITNDNINQLIIITGYTGQLLYNRAEKELVGLQKAASQYDTLDALMMRGFAQNRAFETRQEHEQWSGQLMNALTNTFNVVIGVADTLAEKRGIMWTAKLGLAKQYLNAKMGFTPDVEALPQDLRTTRTAIITSLKEYDTNLMNIRYK